MDYLVNAVAAPVPTSSDDSSYHVNERQSSYKLPKGSKTVEIQRDALKQLKDQGFTDGMSWFALFSIYQGRNKLKTF